MAFADQVQCVAQMQSGDGASRALYFSIIGSRKGDGRAIEYFLETRGDDADRALIPCLIEQSETEIIFRVDMFQCGECIFLHILSLIHISEPTRLGMISYAVFC